MSEEFDIRYSYLTDGGHLKSWLSHPEVQRWFPVSEENEIADAVQCWMGFTRYHASLTGTVGGVPCAIGTLFLMPYRKVAHHCLFKLVVDPKHQNKGYGTSMLKNLKHLAKNYFRLELMHVEVFDGNPFIHLLEKAGFRSFARQEKFVKDRGQYLARILYEVML